MSKRPLYRITKSDREETRVEGQKAKRQRRTKSWEQLAEERDRRERKPRGEIDPDTEMRGTVLSADQTAAQGRKAAARAS